MDSRSKRGRKARGQKGHHQARKTLIPGLQSLNDGVRPNPAGRLSADGNRKSTATIKLCTYNTRTLRTDDDLERLLNQVKNLNWDIIGLCETKRKGEGLWQLQDGTWMFEKAKTEDDKDAKGIAFLVHKDIRKYVIGFKAYSNRIIRVDLNLDCEKTFTVIQLYAPTTSYDDAVVEQFYEDIFKVLRESKAEYKVIMGDVNGRIRSLQSNEQCFALVTSELVIEMNGVREYWISLHLKN